MGSAAEVTIPALWPPLLRAWEIKGLGTEFPTKGLRTASSKLCFSRGLKGAAVAGPGVGG